MQSESRYKIGYVPGVFDMFHVGHLNLIRRAKEQSEYLIAGVLTDELVYHFKKRYPVIPFEQRMEIVGAIQGVDKVVAVDFTNTVKMDAWKLYHYDAYFSGDDHSNEWNHEKKMLNEVGSDIVFLPYTRETSSTKIRTQLERSSKPGRIYLFGSGIIGRRVLRELRTDENRRKWKVEGFLDNSSEKHLTRVDGIPVYKPEDLLTLENDVGEDYIIRITMKEKDTARKQLEELKLSKKEG